MSEVSFNDLLSACMLRQVCPDFTEERWPLESVAPNDSDWEVFEYFFDNDVTIEKGLELLEGMSANGEIRLLTGSRLAMEWIAGHKNSQLHHPVILPLRARDSNGYWNVPIFYCDWFYIFIPFLDLYYLSTEAKASCSWLVLRKRNSVTSALVISR